MRKVIFAINITLDGCCDHTKTIAEEELFDHYIQLLQDADLLVYGRKTYQLMVPYWPDVAKDPSSTKSDREFAQTFVSKNKIVFSRSLESAEEDKNTKIVRTNLRDEILKLKQEPGKPILVGGVDIPSQLIKLGLVDEYYFVVQPIIAGEGRRLLEGISMEKSKLKLVESKILKSGCVALRYLKQ
jgi:dihydrofolate reductase